MSEKKFNIVGKMHLKKSFAPCKKKMFDSCKGKKNPWQNVISGGVCSDPRAWRKTHTHTLTLSLPYTHTDGGPGRAERKKGKKKSSRINVGRAHRTAGKADCRGSSPPFSLQLSLSFFLFLRVAGRLSSSPRSFPQPSLEPLPAAG